MNRYEKAKEYFIKEETDISCLMLSSLVLKYRTVIIEQPRVEVVWNKPNKLIKPGHSLLMTKGQRDPSKGPKVDLAYWMIDKNYPYVYLKVLDKLGCQSSNGYNYHRIKVCGAYFDNEEAIKNLNGVTYISARDYEAVDKQYEETKYALEFFV